MKPELKVYYLVQSAYWCQQLIVLLFNLERPRKDYWELVAHHFVTLWMVGCVDRLVLHRLIPSHVELHSWSYLVNLTLIGGAVYLSMDLPDAFLAVRSAIHSAHLHR